MVQEERARTESIQIVVGSLVGSKGSEAFSELRYEEGYTGP